MPLWTYPTGDVTSQSRQKTTVTSLMPSWTYPTGDVMTLRHRADKHGGYTDDVTQRVT